MSILSESAGLTERLEDFYHIRYAARDKGMVGQIYHRLKQHEYPINKIPNLYDMACWTESLIKEIAPHYTMEYEFIRSFVLEMRFYSNGQKVGAIILQAKKH